MSVAQKFDQGRKPPTLNERNAITNHMTQFNHQIPIQKLADVVDALPSVTLLQFRHHADDFWSVLLTVNEDSSGWTSLKIFAEAVTPTDGEDPEVQMRCLTVGPADRLVFTLSPVARGVDPDHVAARVEAQSMIRFRRSGLGGVLN